MCIRDRARKQRTLNLQELPMKKRMSYMLHHINGMNRMNMVNGSFKTLKAPKMKMQPTMKKVMGLNRRATGMKLMVV
eukprot:6001966-Prorocentrum_lima.AAC.1